MRSRGARPEGRRFGGGEEGGPRPPMREAGDSAPRDDARRDDTRREFRDRGEGRDFRDREGRDRGDFDRRREHRPFGGRPREHDDAGGEDFSGRDRPRMSRPTTSRTVNRSGRMPKQLPKKKKKVRVYFHPALTRLLLPKLLIKAKYLSPVLARQFIEAGRVRVNARVVTSRFYEVNLRKERVTIDEAATEYPRRISYMIYNKPRGVMCEKGDPQFDAIFEPTSTWSFPFGRLAKGVSGLVVLSNDPRMATRQHMLDVELQKEYRVRINRHLNEDEVGRLRGGVLVGDDYLVPLRVAVYTTNAHSMVLDFTLLDDSYHRIFKALKEVGCEVVKMRRARIGLINENMVPPGEWRELSGFEIAALDLARFMPGELPPEPLPPPKPRLNKPRRNERGGGRDGGRGDFRHGDSRGGDRRFPSGPGRQGGPMRRHDEDPDDREERLRQEALADAIGNR